jgi:hypothetical protein
LRFEGRSEEEVEKIRATVDEAVRGAMEAMEARKVGD